MNKKIKKYLLTKINVFVCLLMISLLNSEISYSQELKVQTVGEKDLISRKIKFQGEQIRNQSSNRDWIYTSMEISYITLNTLDLFITHHSLDNGAKEANPIARLYIRNKPLSLIIKGGITAGILFGLTEIKKKDKKAAYITLGLLNMMYGFVVKNNIGVYFELRK